MLFDELEPMRPFQPLLIHLRINEFISQFLCQYIPMSKSEFELSSLLQIRWLFWRLPLPIEMMYFLRLQEDFHQISVKLIVSHHTFDNSCSIVYDGKLV